MTQPAHSSPRPADWAIFLLVPVLFSSNLVFGRGVIGDIAPFITAFIRWAGSTLIMLPALYANRKACIDFVRHSTGLWLILGILGMGICGGLVYWSLTETTASNGTLIYTTSTLFIILFQWLFQGRGITLREGTGMIVAFFGVIVIVLKGNPYALVDFHFNLGDFGILAAAIAFAIYSLLLRKPTVSSMPPIALFGLVALSGAIVLAPPAAIEFIAGAPVPDSPMDWAKMGGIILFASLAAFYCFQHTVRVFGPATAGVTLYMMPPISILMAVIFLGETFETYHLAGILLVTGGVVLATAPASIWRRLRRL